MKMNGNMNTYLLEGEVQVRLDINGARIRTTSGAIKNGCFLRKPSRSRPLLSWWRTGFSFDFFFRIGPGKGMRGTDVRRKPSGSKNSTRKCGKDRPPYVTSSLTRHSTLPQTMISFDSEPCTPDSDLVSKPWSVLSISFYNC